IVGEHAPSSELSTTAQGAFELCGLDDGWNGSIGLPNHLFFCGESLGEQLDSYPLSAPATGLELHVTQLPTVHGQVVWADSGEGVADAYLGTIVHLSDGRITPLMGVQTDAAGRFR